MQKFIFLIAPSAYLFPFVFQPQCHTLANTKTFQSFMKYFIFILVFFFATFATAQDLHTSDTLEAESISEVTVSATHRQEGAFSEKAGTHPYSASPLQWEKATQGIDYSDEKKDAEKKPHDFNLNMPSVDTGMASWLSLTLQILAILAVVLGIAFGIYYTTQAPRDKKIKGEYDVSIEHIDEHLHDTDLMRYLREALAQKDYAVAVRLYFLQMLKDFSASGHIRWAKAKTNRSYLLELSNHKLQNEIAENTRMYETVWFGNTTLTEAGFKTIEPAFRKMLEQTGRSLG
jgi:hypothetical protein